MTMPRKVEFPTYETLLTEAIRSLAVDSGTVSSPAPIGTNVLSDETKNWATDVHRNRLVKIVRGAGAGQIAVVDHNTAKSLLIKQSWTVALDTTSVYVILDMDLAQILRDVFGGGSDISAANPLQVFDPKVFDVLNMATRPAIHLYEGWQDELGIDFTVWTVTNPATGVAWARGADGADLMASSIPNANETARLRSNQRWVAAPTLYGTNKILRRLILEFEMQLANVANMDNTLCFFGLTPAIGNDRSSNNIIGFALLADVLQTLTDLGGVETVNTGFGETLTNKNKLRIEVLLNTVRFYLNETLLATHITNLADLPMYLNFFVDTEAGGAATIKVGVTRAWFEDIVR